jgi:2-oxoisovalerate dehydrogenase E1 component alpha subunit
VTHAAGAAYAFKYRNQPRVAVPVCGDGATSKGDFYEGLNAAGVWGLPCVFAVINNQWAISLPRAKQSACETMAQKAVAAGIPGEQVDGNDVIAVYDRFSRALDKARSGGGPTLIELITYRLRDHTTADDARRYRSDAEVEQHRALDPINRLKKYLIAQDAWSEQQDGELAAEVRAEVEASARAYLDTPPRPPATIFDCLYETLPKAYAGQADRLRSLGDGGHE